MESTRHDKETSDNTTAFERDGVLFPLKVLEPTDLTVLRENYERVFQPEQGHLPSKINKKPHLLLPWLNQLARHKNVIEPVTEILGPDILLWSSMFFSKPAGDPARVAWHQDATYWGLSKPDIVTAWLAFTPSTPESGCLQVVPGTHHREQVPHRVSEGAGNMLSRNQELAVEIDEDEVVDVVLAPGEMSIHHVKLFHGSEPNRADHPRIGYAMRFIAADVEQLTSFRDSATLVAGRDLGNFDLEPTPQSEFDPDAVAYHDRMLKRQAEIQGAL